MNYGNIIKNINDKKYKSKLNFPLNGEKVSEEDIRKVHAENRKKTELFKEDLHMWAIEELDGLTPGQFEIIFDAAWNEHYADGLHSVATHFEDLLDLIKQIRII